MTYNMVVLIISIIMLVPISVIGYMTILKLMRRFWDCNGVLMKFAFYSVFALLSSLWTGFILFCAVRVYMLIGLI